MQVRAGKTKKTYSHLTSMIMRLNTSYISPTRGFRIGGGFSVKKLQTFECQTFLKKLRQSSPVRGSVIINLHLFPLVSSMGLRFNEKRVNSSLELSSEAHIFGWLGFVASYFNSTLGQWLRYRWCFSFDKKTWENIKQIIESEALLCMNVRFFLGGMS